MSTNYNAIASYYDPVTSWFLFFPRQRLVKMLIAHHIRSVLDIGCGTGKLGFFAAAKGLRYTGIDSAAKMLLQGKKLLPRAQKQLFPPTFLYADATSLPFAPASFDATVFSLVLHETDTPPAVLLEKAFSIAPHIAILEWRPVERNLDYLLTFWRHGIERMAGKSHYRHFCDYMQKGGTRGLAQQVGATVIEEEPLQCNSLALYLLQR